MSPLGLAILGGIFVIIIAYIIISRILPMVKNLLDGLITNNVSLGSFMSLLIIIICILVLSEVVNLLLEVEGNAYITYLNLITPGINILTGILPYIKYILLGALIAWGFKSLSK